MAFDHYIEVVANGGSGGSPHFVGQFQSAAAVVDIVHGVNASGGAKKPRMAVAFPDLGEDIRYPAGRVRIFGEKAELSALHPRLVSGLATDARASVAVLAVRSVPEKHTLRGYIRDRSADREFMKRAERAAERAQRKVMARVAKGETIIKPIMPIEDRVESVLATTKSNAEVARLKLLVNSRSNGRGFMLFVRAFEGVNTPADGSKVNSYGLSSAPAERNSVVPMPHF